MKRVLLALNEKEEIQYKLRYEFKKRGLSPEIAKAISLEQIKKLLSENCNYEVLILSENLNQDNYINEESLYEISSEILNHNIVYIIKNTHYGSDFLKKLYDRKIYNCIFIDDATIENIVYISMNPRTRDEAEGYYGLWKNIKNIEREKNYLSNLSLGINKRNRKKKYLDETVIIKEKVVYKTPKDYQNVIGIYSPYSTGKTVISANLASYYTKNKVTVTLIDTDYYKKDLIYYFPLKNSDFLKMTNLYKDIKNDKEINDIPLYGIGLGKRLTLFSDHRDANYKMVFEMIDSIVQSSCSNVIIIDISKDLDKELVNKILSICDERIIVADKIISTLNGLPYKLNLSRSNRKNISLIINKDISIKGLSNKDIIQYFRNIELYGKKKYSINFDEIFFIPNKLELIAERLTKRETAYGKDKHFDDSIERIAAYLYKSDSLKVSKGGILSKLFKK